MDLLNDETVFARQATPLALLREPLLAHNVALFARWCREHGVLAAPHAKTHMAPALIERQLEAGAWGMTVATVAQATRLAAWGVERLIVASEVATASRSPTRSSSHASPAIVRFSPVLPGEIGWPSATSASMRSCEYRHTARSGPPWYFRLRWRSPATPCAVNSAATTGRLGTPPSAATLTRTTRPARMPAVYRARPRAPVA